MHILAKAATAKLVTCPICGDERKIKFSTYYRIEGGYQSGLCHSCGGLVKYYGEGFARWIRYLSRAGCIVPYQLVVRMAAEQDRKANLLRMALQRQGVVVGGRGSASVRHAASIASRRVRNKDESTSCEKCGSTEKLHMHHRWPIEFGGNIEGPFVCMCGQCHREYHMLLRDRILEEYGSILGMRHAIFSQHRAELAHLFTEE